MWIHGLRLRKEHLAHLLRQHPRGLRKEFRSLQAVDNRHLLYKWTKYLLLGLVGQRIKDLTWEGQRDLLHPINSGLCSVQQLHRYLTICSVLKVKVWLEHYFLLSWLKNHFLKIKKLFQKKKKRFPIRIHTFSQKQNFQSLLSWKYSSLLSLLIAI